jgi:hypothetical protein
METARTSRSDANLAPLSTTAATALPRSVEPHLNQDAHRRWETSSAVAFLNKVLLIDILQSNVNENRELVYSLQVKFSARVSSPQLAVKHEAFVVERRFSDLEKLRQDALEVVSALPPCRCLYCLGLLVYLRFKIGQPTAILKLAAGTNIGKKVLVQFVRDLVFLGRRRVAKAGQRACPSQLTIPVLLDEFLRKSG